MHMRGWKRKALREEAGLRGWKDAVYEMLRCSSSAPFEDADAIACGGLGMRLR